MESLTSPEIRIIMDSPYDGMIIADAMGIVMLFNKAAESITGLAKEAVLNKPVSVDIAEGRACT